MISIFFERKRKKSQKTVLGIEYDFASLAAIKLDKKNHKYSLASCDSFIFPTHTSFEDELAAEHIGGVILNIIKNNKLRYFTKLGFVVYKNIDATEEEILCDETILEIISEEGMLYYLKECFFKKKFSENYSDVAFDFYDEISRQGTIKVYYINDIKNTAFLSNIEKKSKKTISACGLDSVAITTFVQALFLSEITKHNSDSILFGLYVDKLCIYSFSPKGEFRGCEAVKIFNFKTTDANYVDEAVQLLLRFVHSMSLEFKNNNFIAEENMIYIYGIKNNFEKVFQSIKKLSMKKCQILNPFINIGVGNYTQKITQPYRYVMSIAIAMMEDL